MEERADAGVVCVKYMTIKETIKNVATATKKWWKDIRRVIKWLFIALTNLLQTFLLLAIVLIAVALPKILWPEIGFKEFLEFIEILAWPVIALIVAFFFRKVFTYMFFSMNEFNFFGAKGRLRDVNNVIMEEVDKKIQEEKDQEKNKLEMQRLSEKIEEQDIEKKRTIQTKDKDIEEARKIAEENINLAKEIFDKWQNSENQSKQIEKELIAENKRLKKYIANINIPSDPPEPEMEDDQNIQETSNSGVKESSPQ